ncbi:glycoside hydrolase family 13 protein [Litorilinea aerophila]|uniref:DUF3459 domain-containing protein n=1 Tax=Litorilinea aerophila TaxID=1204385 RepID=A0A540VBB5_9CHLR|nr:glycoside hydrolase family 13 protein [Litorilinea aerophila]MCC9078088.1 glycoside hydrolase family 13 protein [Litorilinea aerophila]GIV77946.1 MAG: alpha-amylase [Litorilinea sp.]
MPVRTPEWVKDAVFYQIFPDRFARSKRLRHPRGIHFKPWGSPPEEQGFQGGDLLGIVDRLDYLQELGVNALYLNPIFQSAANHRYHTYDYYRVDPLLGGDAALRELLQEAHARGIRVVLDGVFNHASRGFWPFHHILENGGDSPYVDWFYIHGWPLHPYPPDEKTPPNYGAWWGIPALPKLNVANPGVRDYLLDVAEYWIHFGIDGWRLDVPEEIDDEAFWQDFRRVVKRANPDAYIVGEIWHDAQEWLQGDRFDGVMNYGFSRAAFGFFGAQTLRTDYKPGGYELRPLDAPAFARAVAHLLSLYDWEVTQAQLNLMDSHDTARLLWTVQEDEGAARLCVLFQMTMPGAPCIYYGDEIGMSGASDPYCRAAFPWHDRGQWNEALLDFYRRAIALRHRYPVLRRGDLRILYAQGQTFAMLRHLGREAAVIVFNAGNQQATLRLEDLHPLPEGTRLQDVWGEGRDVVVQNGSLSQVTVPARAARIFMAHP